MLGVVRLVCWGRRSTCCLCILCKKRTALECQNDRGNYQPPHDYTPTHPTRFQVIALGVINRSLLHFSFSLGTFLRYLVRHAYPSMQA
jgi:hypothetical protein